MGSDPNVVSLDDAVFRRLKCVDSVVTKLRAGCSPDDVAAFIQEDSQELVAMDRGELVFRLRDMKRRMDEQLGDSGATLTDGGLSFTKGSEVDLLLSLAKFQMTRLEWMRELEVVAKFPLKTMPLEVGAARSIIKAAGDLRAKFALVGVGEGKGGVPGDTPLDAKLALLESRYGQTVMKVLSSPARRRKMLGAIEAFQATPTNGEGMDSITAQTLIDQHMAEGDDDGDDG